VDKDEVAVGFDFYLNRLVFLGHFVDFLLKRAGEEFLLSFIQLFISLIPYLLVSFLICIGVAIGSGFFLAVPAFIAAGILLLLTLEISLLFGIITMIFCYMFGGSHNNILNCYIYAKSAIPPLPILGFSPQLWYGLNTPQIYNENRLANYYI
jgi:hypothetical protein